MPTTFDYVARRANLPLGQVALDVPTFYDECKVAQATAEGILYPAIAIGAGNFSLGSGRASGLIVALLNNWQVKFAVNGQYQATVDGGTLIGGLSGQPIAFTPDVQVILNRPADAFAVSTTGGSAPTAAENAAAVLAAAQANPIHANVKEMNDQLMVGDGTNGDKFRSHLV